MDKNEIVQTVNGFTENARIKFYLGHKNSNNEYSFLQCNIKDEIQSKIFDFLKEEIVAIIDKTELKDYDPVGKEDGTIEYMDAVNVEGYQKIKQNLDDLNNMCNTLQDLGTINFYILEIEEQNRNVKIFRRYSKNKTLKKGFLMRITNDIFDKINDEVFQIDNLIDFILIGDVNFVIMNRYSFEIITNYKDNYTKNLDNALKDIEQSQIIDNIEQFKEDCRESIKIAKQFTKAMQENSINFVLNHKEKFSAAIKEAQLPINFQNDKFIYDNKEQLSILVALLSDKYAKTLIGERITD